MCILKLQKYNYIIKTLEWKVLTTCDDIIVCLLSYET